MEYDRNYGELKLSQEAGATKILKKFGRIECNPAKSPMVKERSKQHKTVIAGRNNLIVTYLSHIGVTSTDLQQICY